MQMDKNVHPDAARASAVSKAFRGYQRRTLITGIQPEMPPPGMDYVVAITIKQSNELRALLPTNDQGNPSVEWLTQTRHHRTEAIGSDMARSMNAVVKQAIADLQRGWSTPQAPRLPEVAALQFELSSINDDDNSRCIHLAARPQSCAVVRETLQAALRPADHETMVEIFTEPAPDTPASGTHFIRARLDPGDDHVQLPTDSLQMRIFLSQVLSHTCCNLATLVVAGTATQYDNTVLQQLQSLE